MQLDQLKRREFISLLGGAAAWPLAARAQTGRAINPVVIDRLTILRRGDQTAWLGI